MKRRRLERHLRDHGCVRTKHGSGHDHWTNPRRRLHTTVPRHTEIKKFLARTICEQLGIPAPAGD